MDSSHIIKEALQNRRKLEIFSYSLLRDWSLAEDAVQDAFVILYKKQENLSSSDNIYGWMKKVVRDKSVDLIRKNSRYTSYDSSMVDLIEKSFDKHNGILQKEKLSLMKKVLEECVSTLEESDVQLLSRFYLKRQKCESLASSLNFSVSAIKKRLSRLRRKLRRCSERRISDLGETL